MNRKSMLIGLALMLGTTLWSPAVLLAGEHGGSEVKEHGGEAVEGSHQHGEGHAATIREAASILKSTHPDLAAKLEAIAAEEE
ncbi:MAG: hypothetical protein HY447_01215 [Candidatus Omnitrophica bacterium]|nr:hypothetical protein [Candidatus Omnitrophota bacterium]